MDPISRTDKPVTDATGREVVGLLQAAEIAQVSFQTITNWAQAGILQEGKNKDVLRELNHRKSGRKHTRYYYRDQVESSKIAEPPDGWVTIEQAAEMLDTTRRTVHRIRNRQMLDTRKGPGNKMYIRRKDVERQERGVTYYDTSKSLPVSSEEEADDPTEITATG